MSEADGDTAPSGSSNRNSSSTPMLSMLRPLPGTETLLVPTPKRPRWCGSAPHPRRRRAPRCSGRHDDDGRQEEEPTMCRWLAYSGSPIALEELLYKPQHSLIDQ